MTIHQQVKSSKAGIEEKLHCVAILNAPPGDQFKTVRKPSNGILGWLQKKEDRFIRRTRPELQLSSHVRGARVAIDYVLHALLTYSNVARFSFLVHDQRIAEFQNWVESRPHEYPVVSIKPLSSLIRGGLQELSPDVWLNLNGDDQFVLRLRNQLSTRHYPTVTLQHGVSAHHLLYEKFFRSMLTSTHASDSLICTSHECAKAVAKIFQSLTSSFSAQTGSNTTFNGRLDVIPLCVNTDQLTPGPQLPNRKRLSITPTAIVLLYIGYLAQSKADVATILPVLARLIADNPLQTIILVIAGTGPDQYAIELRGVVRDFGLMKHVQILREVSDEVKLALMRAADIFVAPCESMQESFGLTPVEAMACGLPQVVADWSGYRETVKHGETGFLIPTTWACTDSDLVFTADLFGWNYDHIHQGQSIAFDLDLLYQRLNELIRNKELRLSMSKASRARALSVFSPLVLAKCYDSLWCDLVALSKQIPLTRGGNKFDAVHYFEYFGHFASHLVTGDYRLVRGSLSTVSLERLMSLSVASGPGIAMLDRELLVKVLKYVEDQYASGKASSLDAAVAYLRTTEDTSSYVTRHIIFLAKFGLIKLIPDN